MDVVLLRIAILGCLLSSASIAVADATPLVLTLKSDFHPVVVKNNGIDGVWFPTDEADYLRQLRANQVPQLIALVNTQLQLIDTQAAQAHTFQDINKLEAQKSEYWEKICAASQAELQAHLNSEHQWYNNHALWVAIGVFVGAASTVGIVYAVHGGPVR